jgi:signal transduction histidine kinase
MVLYNCYDNKEQLTETKIIENDSTRNIRLLDEAYETSLGNDSISFIKANKKAYKSSLKLKDTSGIAATHWNYGTYYAKKELFDSSYYHYYQAYKSYEKINDNYFSGKMLFNMAYVQSRCEDYVSTENKLFEAISKFEPLDKNLSLYNCYKLLGTIYKELENYENSIRYHNIALDHLKRVKNKKGNIEEGALNDIAITYQKQEDYDKAIEYLERVLELEDLSTQNPKLYAKIIDNLAYTKLLKKDTLNIKKDFEKALKIRNKVKDFSGIVVNKLHLADYYIYNLDTLKAITYAKEANDLAYAVENNRDELSSLLLLSKIDTKNASQYLNKYVILNEKLEKNNNKIRNKFARIRFETDTYKYHNNRLSSQNTIILIVAIAVIFILSLLIFIRSERAKNRELILEAQKQQANEDVYKLMLKQQSNLEEGRLKERNRISEELHDGVLGKIFGTRMGLGFLNLQGEEKDKAKQQLYIDELHKIEREIRNISHELKNDVLLSKQDYITLIKALIDEQSIAGNFKYNITTIDEEFWNGTSDIIKINSYRIIQESLLNITKHANATQVNITLGYTNENLNFTIEDDGVGFNNKKTSKGIGISNINSRVKTINGTYSLVSQKNKGTQTTVLIPFKTKTNETD